MGNNGSKQVDTKSSKNSTKLDKKINSRQTSKQNLQDIYNSTRSEKQSPREDANITKRNKKKMEKIAMLNKTKSVIDAASELDVLKIIKKNNHKNEDMELIEKCLLQHFIMRSLASDARNEIIKEMSLCKVDADTFIFRQESIGTFFYIIKEGEVEVFVKDKLIKNLTAGESFGELALLHGAPRSAGVKTVGITYIWCLERRNFRKIVDHINFLNFEENKKFIESVDIFTNIESEFKTILASNMIREYYESDRYILKEGDSGNCLYIIKEGEVDCLSNGRLIRTLKKGENFGAKSILLDSTRTMDVIGRTNCVLYSLSVDTISHMVGEKYKDVLYLNMIKMAFSKSEELDKINPKLLENAFSLFSVKNYAKGEVVLKAGYDLSSKIIIIIEGNLVNEKINQTICKRYDIAFESELTKETNEKLKYDLIADPDCLIVEADKQEFIKILGGSSGNFNELIRRSYAMELLNKIPIFRNLAVNKLEILSKITNVEKYDNGHRIITQGDTDFKLFIIKSGTIDVFINDYYIRTLNDNEFFGERALFFNEPRTATAIANGKVECFSIAAKDLKLILEEKVTEYLKGRFFLQDNSVEIKDLDFVRELGKGNFGSVCLVNSRKNKFYYAIKSMNKRQIDLEVLHKNIEMERDILLKIDHPFIVKLVKTMKDTRNIYFLMEYVKGKELFDVIRAIGLLNDTQTKFYSGCILLGIEYLHQRNFIYRDIKPENIMINENGYVKIIDFGTAKKITDRTMTIIGTPHYMAPEVILGEAICMYEFMCGYVPFGENAEDPMDVYYSIINDKFDFPRDIESKEFKHNILNMLEKNPLKRLNKISNIKSHPYWTNFNWTELFSLEMKSPYCPKIKIKDEEYPRIPYLTYLKNVKDSSKEKPKVDKKTQLEYDNWFKNF